MFDQNEENLAEQQDLGWAGSAISLEKMLGFPASRSVSILINNNNNNKVPFMLFIEVSQFFI